MIGFSVLGEFYVSQILGRPIYDVLGARVGRVADLAISWDAISPRVTGIKFERGLQDHIDVNQVADWNPRGLRLRGVLDKWATRHLQKEEIYVDKWLLRRRLIDLQGYKLVRLNDIRLSWVTRGTTTEVVLMAADIGAKGALRRFHLDKLAFWLKDEQLGWQYIEPLEHLGDNLHVRTDTKISSMHPADIADIIEDLDRHERSRFLANLDLHTIAEALSEANLNVQVDVIRNLDKEKASDVLEEMPPDEAADILGKLSEKDSDELLELMEKEDAEDVRGLMQYPETTAGALMTTEFIAFVENQTAGEIIGELRELAPEAETIYYLYVNDLEGRLAGVLSLRDLIIAPEEKVLTEIMRQRIVYVNHQDDIGLACDAVRKYFLLAVPVVDDDHRLVGIITMDDVIDRIVPERSGIDLLAMKRPHAMRNQEGC
jgi:CBS domain-containing protein